MEVQTTNGQPLTQIQYSPNQVALGKQVRRLSLAGNPSFPIPDAFIIDYIQNIEEQAPDITPAILQKIVNKMLTGKLPYDVNKGIRNIFEGYEAYKDDVEHYHIVNVNTGYKLDVSKDNDLEKYDKDVWMLLYIKQHGRKVLSQADHPFERIDENIWEMRERYLDKCRKGMVTPVPFTSQFEKVEVGKGESKSAVDTQKAEIIDCADEDLDF